MPALLWTWQTFLFLATVRKYSCFCECTIGKSEKVGKGTWFLNKYEKIQKYENNDDSIKCECVLTVWVCRSSAVGLEAKTIIERNTKQ